MFSNSFGLTDVFEKLRFRDGLVWAVGLTVEIKLRFQTQVRSNEGADRAMHGPDIRYLCCEVDITVCFVDGKFLSSIYLPVKFCKQSLHGYMTAKLLNRKLAR